MSNERPPPASSSDETGPVQPAVNLEKLSRANSVQPGKPAGEEDGHSNGDRDEAARRLVPNQQ